jgi:hypothetical protein
MGTLKMWVAGSSEMLALDVTSQKTVLLHIPTVNSAAFTRQINPFTPELNPSAQLCLSRFLLGILIFKGHDERRLCKSFGGEGLNTKPTIL